MINTIKIKCEENGGRVKLSGLGTDLGYDFIVHLKKNGWIQIGQYSPSMFDKGVDYDRYSFFKWFKLISMEWSNWMDWDISGGTAGLMSEITKYAQDNQMIIEFITKDSAPYQSTAHGPR